jgi:hypothetical protein
MSQACNLEQKPCGQAINLFLNDTLSPTNEQIRQKNINFDMVYEQNGRNQPIGQFLIPTWNMSQKEEPIPDILGRVFTITRNKFGDPMDIVIPIRDNDDTAVCPNGERRNGWWYCKYSLIGAQQLTHSPMLRELYQFQSYTAVSSAYVYFKFPNERVQQALNAEYRKTYYDAIPMRAAEGESNNRSQLNDRTEVVNQLQTVNATPTVVSTPVAPTYQARAVSQTPDPAAYCRIYSGENLPLAINDNAESISYAYINEKFNINQIKITNLNITHTYVGDLTIKLISPLGESRILFYKHGGGGDNFVNTTFDDNASTLEVGLHHILLPTNLTNHWDTSTVHQHKGYGSCLYLIQEMVI